MGYFDHLAIAVDFSEASRVALAASCALSGLVGAKRLSVVHALKGVVLPSGDTPAVTARLESLGDRIRSAAQTNLETMVDALDWPEGLSVELQLVEGSPARVIPDSAVELGADVLLVGTHSRKGLKRWISGSVAEKIVEGARLPILVLPTGDDGVPPEAELAQLEHLLVAVDVHREADHVVRAALEAATAFEGKEVDVTLLTVADLSGIPALKDDEKLVGEFLDALRSDAERQLVSLEARNGGDVDQLHHEVRQGDPDEEILKEAQDRNARLIVVGSHGQDHAPLLQLGSTTAHVIRNADVSVLVIPAHPEHGAR